MVKKIVLLIVIEYFRLMESTHTLLSSYTQGLSCTRSLRVTVKCMPMNDSGPKLSCLQNLCHRAMEGTCQGRLWLLVITNCGRHWTTQKEIKLFYFAIGTKCAYKLKKQKTAQMESQCFPAISPDEGRGKRLAIRFMWHVWIFLLIAILNKAEFEAREVSKQIS